MLMQLLTESQFIFGKNPFVREYTLHEGPAFADKTICISRTFDPIETSDMEDPRTLIALEPVEKLHTAVFQIGPGNFRLRKSGSFRKFHRLL